MTEDMLAHRPLLCRIPLLPGESLGSYLTRLAAVNCYDPPSLLTRLCGRRLGVKSLRRRSLIHPNRAEIFEVLASLGGLTPRELANASIHYFARAPVLARMSNSTITLSDGAPLQLLDPRSRSRYLSPEHCARFCPDCLREAAYHRLDWTPQDIWACLEHRRFLLNQCPECNRWVSVRDVVQCQCETCGADLTDAAPGHSLEPFDIFAQRTIRTWWGLDVPEAASGDWSLLDQPVPTLHHLFGMMQESIEAEKSASRTVPGRYNVQRQAFKALADWPTGFCDFLRARLEHQVRIRSYDSWCDFSSPVCLRDNSPFAFWICGLPSWPRFGFVQEAVDRFFVENNIQVESEYAKTYYIIEADEELQEIARPIAEMVRKRIAKIVESL